MDRQQVVLALLIALFAVSCFDSFDSYVPSDKQDPIANSTISELHTLYAKGVRDISQDIIVQGVVTANDEHRNSFKSFVIEHNGYAIEILEGIYDSHIRYPLGSTVVIKSKGLRLAESRGVLRIGLPAATSSPYDVEHFTADAIAKLYISATKRGEAITPKVYDIKDLDEGECGRLISIKGLQPLFEDGVERSWSGYALFRDSGLDSVWCYTSPYANFAQEKIQQGEMTLSGILEFGTTESHSNKFILRPHEVPSN